MNCPCCTLHPFQHAKCTITACVIPPKNLFQRSTPPLLPGDGQTLRRRCSSAVRQLIQLTGSSKYVPSFNLGQKREKEVDAFERIVRRAGALALSVNLCCSDTANRRRRDAPKVCVAALCTIESSFPCFADVRRIFLFLLSFFSLPLSLHPPPSTLSPSFLFPLLHRFTHLCTARRLTLHANRCSSPPGIGVLFLSSLLALVLMCW